MTNIDSQITILIPTRNRSHFINRALSYYKEMNFKCAFIIGDSSIDLKEKDNTRNFCEQYRKDLNLIYKHYSNDIGFGDKLSEICSLAQTKYTAIIGDDDLIILNGLLEGSKFLDLNEDTVGVYGERIGLMMTDSVNNSNDWYSSRQFRTRNIYGKDFIQRINCLETPNWSQHLYSLYRTEALRNSLNFIKGQNYNSNIEYLLYMSIAIAGNWIKLDNLFAVCTFENNFNKYRDINSFPHYWGEDGSILRQLSNPNVIGEINTVVDRISMFFANKYDVKVVKEEILKCFWYNNSIYLSKTLAQNKTTFQKLISKLGLIFKLDTIYFICNFLKSIFTKIFWLYIFSKESSFGIYQKKQSNIFFIISSIFHFSTLYFTMKSLQSKNNLFYDDYMSAFKVWLKFPLGKDK